MVAWNPVAPQAPHLLTTTIGGKRHCERFASTPTYTYQLRAFVDAIQSGATIPTGPDDAVANMRVIDAVYRSAGLSLRGT